MNGLRVVLPVLREDYTTRCVNSLLMEDNSSGFTPDEILIVDNSRDGFGSQYGLRTHRDPDGHNLGVARAWNVGAREVLEENLDYLVVLSTSVEFGPLLHQSFRSEMDQVWGKKIIEAHGHSWHLIAFHRRLFELVGLFDENFYPAYEEAIDFGHRLELMGLQDGIRRVWVNAMSWGSGNHIDTVSCPNPPLAAYYAEKWGGAKGDEQYFLPFGDKPIDYWEDRSVEELAAKYELKEWW